MPKRLFHIILIPLLLSGCIEQYNFTDTGVLAGKISIGPLCPVEQDPPLTGCSPTAETYKAWQTSVWNKNKTRIITDIQPELSGKFSLKLPAGRYIIDYKASQQHYIGGNNMPIEVLITKDDTINVQIDIDTGIR